MNHHDMAWRIMNSQAGRTLRQSSRKRRAYRIRRALGRIGFFLWGLLVLGVNVGIVLIILHFVIKYW